MHALTHKARILALQPKLSASRIIGQKQMDGLRSNFEPLCFPKSCNSDDILLQLEFRARRSTLTLKCTNVSTRHLRATRKSAVRPCILHPSVARGIHSFRSTRFERTEQMTTNQEWMTERAGRVGEGCKMQGRPVWHASVCGRERR